MISKYLSFGFVAAGALLIGVFTQQGTNIEDIGVSDYSPRVYTDEISTQHDGAEEIYRMLMAPLGWPAVKNWIQQTPNGTLPKRKPMALTKKIRLVGDMQPLAWFDRG